jgi:hypothetical protein
MFRLFKGADSTIQNMFRRTRNYSVKREVNYVKKSVGAKTSYGISVHVQMKRI